MENMSINESGARLHLAFQFPVFNPSLTLGKKGAKERREEVIFCLQRNLLSPHIHTIHILCEEARNVLSVKALNLSTALEARFSYPRSSHDLQRWVSICFTKLVG